MSDIAIEQEVATPAQEVNFIDALGHHVILFEDSVGIMVGNNSSAIEKRISYEDFATIIGAITDRRTNHKMEGFQLPANCFYFARSSNEINLSCYYAERTATIKHVGSRSYEIKFPNTIISHKLVKHNTKDWKVQESRYFVTDKKVTVLPKTFIFEVSANNRIWLFPFPNTYSEGRMCYGGNSMPTVFSESNLAGLNWHYQFLFDSPFNNDLGIRSLANEPSITDWFRKLEKANKDNTPFPYNELRGYTAAI